MISFIISPTLILYLSAQTNIRTYRAPISIKIYLQEWRLQATGEDTRIKLTFESFNLEAQATEACNYDYVEVSYETFGVTWKYCGTSLPGPITSWGSSMKVRFHSDLLGAGTGFLAKWEEIYGKTKIQY